MRWIVSAWTDGCNAPVIRLRRGNYDGGIQYYWEIYGVNSRCGKPVLKLDIVFRIECPESRILRDGIFYVAEMRVKQRAHMALRAFVLMNVRRRCLRSGQQQGNCHRDGGEKTHAPY